MMSAGIKLALGFGFAVALCGSASATPITFTWNPTAVGMTTSPANTNIVASNMNVADFADISVNNGTGAFIENGVLNVTGFLNNGTTVLDGLGSNYSFYITVKAAGTQGAIPANGSGTSADGTFSSADYTFWATPNAPLTITNNMGGTPSIAGNGSPVALFTGTLVNGTTTLTAPAGGGYSPTANLNLSISACTAAGQSLSTGGTCSGNESAFFVDPLPADLSLVISNFSATTSETTLTPGSPNSFIDIDGGGGNITFDKLSVPEPASLLVLASSLLGFGMLRRRRSPRPIRA
jgi:hypothetical protein